MINRTRLTRAIASIALASGVLLGTSACVFMTPIATLEEYDPSDGINATVGTVDLRNVIVFVDEETGAASLMVTLVNTGDKEAQLSLQFASGGDDVTVVAPVGGLQVLSFGTTPDEEQILILDAGTRPGALFPVYVQYGANQGQQLTVPVLSATGVYEGLGPVIPEPEPTPTPTATPAPEETPAP